MKKYIRKILEDLDYYENQIEVLTKDEILDEVLKYEGIIGYTDKIKTLIKDIYEIEIK